VRTLPSFELMMQSHWFVAVTPFSFLCSMLWMRSLRRFFYFAFSTIIHIAGYYFLRLRGKSKQDAGTLFRKKWLSHVPHNIGIRATVIGSPCKMTCLFVGNHISYLDPFLILMQADANVVAKAEVFRWPIIGIAGSLIGTIYVQREKKTSRHQTANAIHQALSEGHSIIVFPEGTTTKGKSTLPFRPRCFEAARLADACVQPVAISYESPLAPFIDKDTFIPHFFRFFQLKEIRCTISFGPVSQGHDTCGNAQDWIDQQLSPSMLYQAV
jgi:1-acyl-sn-glycerol-3-phosphate acyltransferase